MSNRNRFIDDPFDDRYYGPAEGPRSHFHSWESRPAYPFPEDNRNMDPTERYFHRNEHPGLNHSDQRHHGFRHPDHDLPDFHRIERHHALHHLDQHHPDFHHPDFHHPDFLHPEERVRLLHPEECVRLLYPEERARLHYPEERVRLHHAEERLRLHHPEERVRLLHPDEEHRRLQHPQRLIPPGREQVLPEQYWDFNQERQHAMKDLHRLEQRVQTLRMADQSVNHPNSGHGQRLNLVPGRPENPPPKPLMNQTEILKHHPGARMVSVHESHSSRHLMELTQPHPGTRSVVVRATQPRPREGQPPAVRQHAPRQLVRPLLRNPLPQQSSSYSNVTASSTNKILPKKGTVILKSGTNLTVKSKTMDTDISDGKDNNIVKLESDEAPKNIHSDSQNGKKHKVQSEVDKSKLESTIQTLSAPINSKMDDCSQSVSDAKNKTLQTTTKDFLDEVKKISLKPDEQRSNTPSFQETKDLKPTNPLSEDIKSLPQSESPFKSYTTNIKDAKNIDVESMQGKSLNLQSHHDRSKQIQEKSKTEPESLHQNIKAAVQSQGISRHSSAEEAQAAVPSDVTMKKISDTTTTTKQIPLETKSEATCFVHKTTSSVKENVLLDRHFEPIKPLVSTRFSTKSSASIKTGGTDMQSFGSYGSNDMKGKMIPSILDRRMSSNIICNTVVDSKKNIIKSTSKTRAQEKGSSASVSTPKQIQVITSRFSNPASIKTRESEGKANQSIIPPSSSNQNTINSPPEASYSYPAASQIKPARKIEEHFGFETTTSSGNVPKSAQPSKGPYQTDTKDTLAPKFPDSMKLQHKSVAQPFKPLKDILKDIGLDVQPFESNQEHRTGSKYISTNMSSVNEGSSIADEWKTKNFDQISESPNLNTVKNTEVSTFELKSIMEKVQDAKVTVAQQGSKSNMANVHYPTTKDPNSDGKTSAFMDMIPINELKSILKITNKVEKPEPKSKGSKEKSSKKTDTADTKMKYEEFDARKYSSSGAKFLQQTTEKTIDDLMSDTDDESEMEKDDKRSRKSRSISKKSMDASKKYTSESMDHSRNRTSPGDKSQYKSDSSKDRYTKSSNPRYDLSSRRSMKDKQRHDSLSPVDGSSSYSASQTDSPRKGYSDPERNSRRTSWNKTEYRKEDLDERWHHRKEDSQERPHSGQEDNFRREVSNEQSHSRNNSSDKSQSRKDSSGKEDLDESRYSRWDDSNRIAHSRKDSSGKEDLDESRYSRWDDSNRKAHSRKDSDGKEDLDERRFSRWDDSSYKSHSKKDSSGKEDLNERRFSRWDDYDNREASRKDDFRNPINTNYDYRSGQNYESSRRSTESSSSRSPTKSSLERSPTKDPSARRSTEFRSPTKAPLSRSPTKSSSERSPTKASSARTQSSSDRRSTESSSFRSPTKSSLERNPTKSSSARSPTKASSERRSTEYSSSRSPTKSSSARSSTKSSLERSPTKLSLSRSPSKFSLERNPTKFSLSRSPSKSSLERNPTKSSLARSFTESSSPRSSTKSSLERSPTKFSSSRSPTKSSLERNPQKSSSDISPAKQFSSRSPTKSSSTSSQRKSSKINPSKSNTSFTKSKYSLKTSPSKRPFSFSKNSPYKRGSSSRRNLYENKHHELDKDYRKHQPHTSNIPSRRELISYLDIDPYRTDPEVTDSENVQNTSTSATKHINYRSQYSKPTCSSVKDDESMDVDYRQRSEKLRRTPELGSSTPPTVSSTSTDKDYRKSPPIISSTKKSTKYSPIVYNQKKDQRSSNEPPRSTLFESAIKDVDYRTVSKPEEIILSPRCSTISHLSINVPEEPRNPPANTSVLEYAIGEAQKEKNSETFKAIESDSSLTILTTNKYETKQSVPSRPNSEDSTKKSNDLQNLKFSQGLYPSTVGLKIFKQKTVVDETCVTIENSLSKISLKNTADVSVPSVKEPYTKMDSTQNSLKPRFDSHLKSHSKTPKKSRWDIKTVSMKQTAKRDETQRKDQLKKAVSAMAADASLMESLLEEASQQSTQQQEAQYSNLVEEPVRKDPEAHSGKTVGKASTVYPEKTVAIPAFAKAPAEHPGKKVAKAAFATAPEAHGTNIAFEKHPTRVVTETTSKGTSEAHPSKTVDVAFEAHPTRRVAETSLKTETKKSSEQQDQHTITGMTSLPKSDLVRIEKIFPEEKRHELISSREPDFDDQPELCNFNPTSDTLSLEVEQHLNIDEVPDQPNETTIQPTNKPTKTTYNKNEFTFSLDRKISQPSFEKATNDIAHPRLSAKPCTVSDYKEAERKETENGKHDQKKSSALHFTNTDTLKQRHSSENNKRSSSKPSSGGDNPMFSKFTETKSGGSKPPITSGISSNQSKLLKAKRRHKSSSHIGLQSERTNIFSNIMPIIIDSSSSETEGKNSQTSKTRVESVKKHETVIYVSSSESDVQSTMSPMKIIKPKKKISSSTVSIDKLGDTSSVSATKSCEEVTTDKKLVVVVKDIYATKTKDTVIKEVVENNSNVTKDLTTKPNQPKLKLKIPKKTGSLHQHKEDLSGDNSAFGSFLEQQSHEYFKKRIKSNKSPKRLPVKPLSLPSTPDRNVMEYPAVKPRADRSISCDESKQFKTPDKPKISSDSFLLKESTLSGIRKNLEKSPILKSKIKSASPSGQKGQGDHWNSGESSKTGRVAPVVRSSIDEPMVNDDVFQSYEDISMKSSVEHSESKSAASIYGKTDEIEDSGVTPLPDDHSNSDDSEMLGSPAISLNLDGDDDDDDDVDLETEISLLGYNDDIPSKTPTVIEVREESMDLSISIASSSITKTIPVSSNSQLSSKPSNTGFSLDDLLAEKDTEVRNRDLLQMQDELKEDIKKGGFKVVQEEALADSCNDDLLPEQARELEKLQVTDSVINELHPGETVFHSESFLRVFNELLKPSHCGFTPGGSLIDQQLSNVQSDLLTDFLASGILTMCFHRITNPESICRWLFYIMSIHRSSLVVHSCQRLLMDLIQTQVTTDNTSITWSPSPLDLLKIFINYGAKKENIVPEDNCYSSDEISTILEPTLEHGVDNNNNNNSLYLISRDNLLSVLDTLSCALQARPDLKTDELTFMVEIIVMAAMDKSLNNNKCHYEFQVLVSSVLECYDKDVWYNVVPELCDRLSKISSHHHNRVYVVQLLPPGSRGHYLQQRLAAVLLHEEMTGSLLTQCPDKIQIKSLFMYVDYMKKLIKKVELYKLCSCIMLMDLVVGNETIATSEKAYLNKLSEMINVLKGDLRDSVQMLDKTRVKDLMVRISSKWTLMISTMGSTQRNLFSWTVHKSPQKMRVETLETQSDHETDGSESETENQSKDSTKVIDSGPKVSNQMESDIETPSGSNSQTVRRKIVESDDDLEFHLLSSDDDLPEL